MPRPLSSVLLVMLPTAVVALAGCEPEPLGGVTVELVARPSALDFGAREPGTRTSLDVAIENTGAASVSLPVLFAEGDERAAFQVLASPPLDIAPGKSATLTVEYLAPAEAGSDDATLVVAEGLSDGARVEVTLTARVKGDDDEELPPDEPPPVEPPAEDPPADDPPPPVEAPGSWLDQLAAGSRETCGVSEAGAVFCFASIDEAPTAKAGINDALDVSTDWRHSCAIDGTGGVFCWGLNDEGQLGTGGSGDVTVEEPQETLAPWAPATAIEVEVSARGTCVLTSDGDVYCWGNNEYGQVGSGSLDHPVVTPERVNLPVPADELALGDVHACARADGDVYCWGNNGLGQLGDGSLPTISRSEPGGPLPIGEPVVDVDASYRLTCAVGESGAVYCWGEGFYGGVGPSVTTYSLSPVALGVTDAESIATGHWHACVTRTGGQVSCWGYNHFGQLGDGTDDDAAAPQHVAGLGDVVAVFAGAYHTCALEQLPDWRRTVCWGKRSFSFDGDDVAASPVEVALP